jgi:osmotically-inducible protein OsmY
MNRKHVLFPLVAVVLLLGIACGSMNRATPAEWDATSMKADVKSKIAAVDPTKTFDIGVTIDDHKVVTLTGNVDTADEARKIGEAAGSVNGVSRVINNIQVRR